MESPLIFFMQKNKEKTKYKIKIQKCFECYWLNKEQYNFSKLNLTIYVKEYNAFSPSYNLPKIKTIRH